MFQIYLMKLLMSGKKSNEKPWEAPSIDISASRRIYNRYDVQDKNLTIRNKQDIFLIRNISRSGFNVQVPKRSFVRLEQGDIYRCKMRYMDESYSCDATVRWKKGLSVGFELSPESVQTQKFFLRLARPLEIGSSLQKDTKDKLPPNVSKFSGLSQTDIYLWQTNKQTIKEWLFQNKLFILKYNSHNKQFTKIKLTQNKNRVIPSHPFKITEKGVELPSKKEKIFVKDILMASTVHFKNELLSTLIN